MSMSINFAIFSVMNAAADYVHDERSQQCEPCNCSECDNDYGLLGGLLKKLLHAVVSLFANNYNLIYCYNAYEINSDN